MNIFKCKIFISLLALTAIFAVSCSDNSTNPVDSLTPPSNLIATTIDNTTCKITWDHSTAKDSSWFQGYYIKITPSGFDTTVSKNVNSYTLYNAQPGTEYTFYVQSVNTSKVYSKISVQVSWMGGPNPPTSLMANSFDSDTIGIKWTPSVDIHQSWFLGYKIRINGQFNSQIIDKNSDGLKIYGLSEGKLYTIDLFSVNKDTILSAVPATVTWAPAKRFYGIKLYESASSFGSGLKIFDSTENAPVSLTILNGDEWDFALDTKSSSWDIGSVSLLNYSSISNPRTTYLIIPNDSYKGVKGLDDVFDTQMLNPTQQQIINLNGVIQGFVFAIENKYHYFAKVFVHADGGSVINGTGSDRYVLLDLSVQRVPNVPYAKVHSIADNSGDASEINNLTLIPVHNFNSK